MVDEKDFHETMDINSKAGTKVTVTSTTIKNGYDGTMKHAEKHLKIGSIYTIKKIIIYNWSTEIHLEEFPDEIFNSVSFTDIKE